MPKKRTRQPPKGPRNAAAKALSGPHNRPRVIAAKKGKGSFKRRPKHRKTISPSKA